MTPSALDMQRVWSQFERYQDDPVGFWIDVLKWPEPWIWSGMAKMAQSVRDNPRTAVKAGHGVSKRLDVDTPILTGNQFVRLGDICEGDAVYGEHGQLVTVLGHSPVERAECYEVCFDDGSSLVATGDHLWSVHGFLDRKRFRRHGGADYRLAWPSCREMTTDQIAASLLHNGQHNISIPVTMPLSGVGGCAFPYTTGVWLAEGSRNFGSVTLNHLDSPDILAGIQREGFQYTKPPSAVRDGAALYTISGLRSRLREVGVLAEKSIPDSWLSWCYDKRLALLRGYMDGDGWWVHPGIAAVVTTNKRLSDGIASLIASFGWRVYRHTHTAKWQGGSKPAYSTYFSPDVSVFTVSRKASVRHSNHQHIRRTMRIVRSVEPVGVREVCCLQVDSPSHLFLAGRDLIPTHNSHTMSGLALWFLYSFPPATVVTTAPTEKQVQDILWREIRESHAKSGVLFGEPKTLTLDLQPESGLKWFATGFSAKPDTVTKEATSFQGYHNDNLLIIFDEAAGVMPEIWRAAEHIGGNRMTRFVAVGNPTTAAGDFPRCFRDPSYSRLTIPVTSTPNYIEGSNRIPGVYGRDYEARIITKYGRDSDEYRVRVLGEISSKQAPGAYYAAKLQWLRDHDRIGTVQHDPQFPVYTVWDPGFTTAIWFFQPSPGGIWRFLRYYEACGEDMASYATLLDRFAREDGYRYGQHFAPFDVDNNQYRLVHADGLQAVAARAGIQFTAMEMERSVEDGIERTREFLGSCAFDAAGCDLGLDRLAMYHQKVNKAMSSDERIVFIGHPDKDGSEHGADSMRYGSKCVHLINPAAGVTSFGGVIQRPPRPLPGRNSPFSF